MTSQEQNPNRESAIEFPCRFPIKAMGRSADGFEATVVSLVRRHADLWVGDGKSVTTNDSRQGNYIAVTVVVEATSQDQLDAIYRDLTGCPDVLMAL
ncbi:MAG: DUF493 domain-containing protein [Xanthomonadales bacterium]|nr:DUF493 domain-containing protein [Gammaproteobacteria bacterium]MBT8051858.1 DUF493 domain-containing protein [Gammaproteobacteria bacterium]MBT8057880.1 DUF493 domain-containing protein [Gammaproteobacteria bacterium]NNJ80245.1 DUF493 domain-containing protein [Xanthomonadales bacterium]NNL03701.1 DUF493 domain-containing protein [Xanthomonadales bacterium]